MRAWIAVFALFVGSQSLPVLAEDGPGDSVTDPLKAPPENVTDDFVQGEVTSTNSGCQTLLVQAENGPYDLLIKAKTEIFIERERVKELSAIPTGYIARAYFLENGDAARILVVKDKSSLPPAVHPQ